MMAYSKALMQRLAQKLDLAALQKVLNEDLQWQDTKPLFLGQEVPDVNAIDINQYLENEEFLINLHDICCRRHITYGHLQCQNCSRVYEIKNGIINMLLNEDEV